MVEDGGSSGQHLLVPPGTGVYTILNPESKRNRCASPFIPAVEPTLGKCSAVFPTLDPDGYN